MNIPHGWACAAGWLIAAIVTLALAGILASAATMGRDIRRSRGIGED
jgi:hypothetical protein